MIRNLNQILKIGYSSTGSLQLKTSFCKKMNFKKLLFLAKFLIDFDSFDSFPPKPIRSFRIILKWIKILF